MTVFEMQEPPEDDYSHYDDIIRTVRRQYDEGTTCYDKFQQQLALMYSLKKDPFLCRYHAALLPPTADGHLLAEVQVSLGRIAAFEKDIPAAIQAYQKAVGFHPDHDTAREELAHCLLNAERWAEALTHYDIALADNTTDDLLWQGRGRALFHLHRVPEAIQSFTRGMAEDTDAYSHHVYHYYLGICYQHTNDNYRAMHHYTQSLQLRPNFPEALTNMGALRFHDDDELYDVQAAIQNFKQVQAIAEAQNLQQLKVIAYTNLSRIYHTTAEFDLHDEYKEKMLAEIGFTPEFRAFLDNPQWEDDDEEEDTDPENPDDDA